MTVLDYVKYAETSRRAAAEGAVLLKNEGGVLPIQSEQTVALFGRTQYDTIYCGTGSGGLVNVPYVVSIHEGLSAVRSLEPVSQEAYAAWLPDHPFDEGQGWAATPWSQDEMTVSPELAARSAGSADLAVVVIGRTAGEDRDNVAKKGAYYLTDTEMDVLRNVRQAFPRLAVVLNTGNIIDMSWQEEIRPDAILSVWQGGCEVGHAVADVLTGKVNPSGKLPDTVAYSLEDYPASDNFGGAHEIVYAEDIYVGYRYFETFARDKVLYPFGFGLSYSTFDFDLESFESGDESVKVSASLKNVGGPEGKNVLQLYVQAPQGKLGQPLRRLVGFDKSRTLGAGEREVLSFEVQAEDLASCDDSGVSGYRNAYVLEAGDYEFFLGFDVRSAVSCGIFSVAETRLIEQLREAMAPMKTFRRLRPEVTGEAVAEGKEDVPVRSVPFEQYLDERSREAEAQHD